MPVDKLHDREAGVRFDNIVSIGRELFSGSAVIEPASPVSYKDIDRIERFLDATSPTSPVQVNGLKRLPEWRLQARTKFEPDEIADASSYGNWHSLGGPFESSILAGLAGAYFTRRIKDTMREPTGKLKATLEEISQTDPIHVAAAGFLHDIGREVTHTYFTTDRIGDALLRRIGVRPDLARIVPDEAVMLAKPGEMYQKIQSLPVAAILVRLGDEFGKRNGATGKLYLPEDYGRWDRNTWADNYLERPVTGRPSDRFMREEDKSRKSRMQLHVDNVPDYFISLDKWIKSVSTTSLSALTAELADILSPDMALNDPRPLSKKVEYVLDVSPPRVNA